MTSRRRRTKTQGKPLRTFSTGLPFRLASPWPFLGLVVLWSWLFWVPAALAHWPMQTWPGALMVALGGISPVLGAVLLIGVFESREFRRDFWRRLTDPRRLRAWWWLALLLVPAAPALAGIASAAMLGQLPADWQPVWPAVTQPLESLPLLLFYLLFGPLPEEPGWRGYALDRMAARHGRLGASLILGLVWAVWHWPMFLIPGSILAQKFSGDALMFWCGWFLPVLARSVLFTWVFYGSGRSILAVVLLHFTFNLCAEVVRLPDSAILWRSFWEILMALLIAGRWLQRPRLARSENTT